MSFVFPEFSEEVLPISDETRERIEDLLLRMREGRLTPEEEERICKAKEEGEKRIRPLLDAIDRSTRITGRDLAIVVY